MVNARMTMSKIDLDELRRIYHTLTKDIEHIIGKPKKRPPQFKRSSFIRAFVALVEFDTYNRKQRALYLHNNGFGPFNDSELILLQEIQSEVDGKGQVKQRPKHIRMIDNYLFAINMFCKISQIEFRCHLTVRVGQPSKIRSN